MILSQGANSLKKGSYQYIYDDFVVLLNGLTDSGYPINDGSLGTLLRDANGSISAPDGLGMPYYARSNFSTNNGGPSVNSEDLVSIFFSKIYTMDFWYKMNMDAAPDTPFILGTYDQSFGNNGVAIRYTTGGGKAALSFEYKGTNAGFALLNSGWNHVANVSDGTNLTTYVNGIRRYKKESIDAVPQLSKIRFRTGGASAGICISQFALRDYAVWTDEFIPPNRLYCQR